MATAKKGRSKAKGAKGKRVAEWRRTVASALDWRQAHAPFEAAVKDLPPELRGRRPTGLPHSPWELVEHIRLTQADLLNYMENPKYTAPEWPRDYWPPSPKPSSADAWDRSIEAVQRDRKRLRAIMLRPSLDPTQGIPWGDGHTYLRTMVVAITHASYHIGQIILTRRLLGAWSAS